MAATAAQSGFGTLLKMGDGASPEVFTTIAEITDIAGPNYAAPTLDALNNDSPSSAMERISNRFYDAESVTFTIQSLISNATHLSVLATLKAFTKKNFTVTYPNGTGEAFSGFVSEFKRKAPIKDKLTADVKIDITGPIAAAA